MDPNSTAGLPNPFADDPDLRRLIQRDRENGHWLWVGDIDRDGYGVVYREGYNWRAHRWVWTLIHGLTDLPLDHLCRTRNCVNPEHLEPVTTAVNNERIPTWGGNAEKCSKGHPFTKENTLSRSDGKRRCRICHREQEAERRKRKSATS